MTCLPGRCGRCGPVLWHLWTSPAPSHPPAMHHNVLYACARSVSYGGAPPAQPSDLAAAQEEQAAVEEKRKELFTLFKNLAKIVFAEVLAFVGSALGTVFARQDAPWQVGCVPVLSQAVRLVRVSGC